MNNREQNDESLSAGEFPAFVRHETQLVWARYSVMVIAHSVILAFIVGVDTSNINLLPFGVACIGVVLAYLWWAITTFGWSLAHEWVERWGTTISPVKTPYQHWAPHHSLWGHDFIWWSAHIIIWVFVLAYTALGIWLSMNIWPYAGWGLYTGVGLLFIFPMALTLLVLFFKRSGLAGVWRKFVAGLS